MEYANWMWAVLYPFRGFIDIEEYFRVDPLLQILRALRSPVVDQDSVENW